MMQPIEGAYFAFSTVIVLASVAMVWNGVRAYTHSPRSAMIHLVIGFTLIAAATLATLISALITDFTPTRSLLAVNSGITACGFLFILYSVVAYDQ